MTRNENLPPGTLASDVSSEYECETCGGYGRVEDIIHPDDAGGEKGHTEIVTCPDCAGLGLGQRKAQAMTAAFFIALFIACAPLLILAMIFGRKRG